MNSTASSADKLNSQLNDELVSGISHLEKNIFSNDDVVVDDDDDDGDYDIDDDFDDSNILLCQG